jgi:phenylalanyl-tRNA synthetase alpha chain
MLPKRGAFLFIIKNMQEKLLNLKNEAIAQIIQAADPEETERLRGHYLGKNGVLSEIAKEIPRLPLENRIEVGQVFNDVKIAISNAIASKSQNSTQKSEKIDLSLPGTNIAVGLLHPITTVTREINDIFKYLGFSVADGPEIETDEYNYDRLNLPADHPARDLQDSLYIKEPDILLRTQISSVESHILENHRPPYRFVIPGKAYRYENVSATNHMMFYQYQGVAVGENLTLANLKWTLETFINKFYGPNRKARFRNKYYPEVEPGMGVDIDCPFCNGLGCAICKQRGWIEILGSGMIHPNILKRVKLDPKIFTGFAWGMGLDRITMTRYGFRDIRSLFNGDLIYKT